MNTVFLFVCLIFNINNQLLAMNEDVSFEQEKCFCSALISFKTGYSHIQRHHYFFDNNLEKVYFCPNCKIIANTKAKFIFDHFIETHNFFQQSKHLHKKTKSYVEIDYNEKSSKKITAFCSCGKPKTRNKSEQLSHLKNHHKRIETFINYFYCLHKNCDHKEENVEKLLTHIERHENKKQTPAVPIITTDKGAITKKKQTAQKKKPIANQNFEINPQNTELLPQTHEEVISLLVDHVDENNLNLDDEALDKFLTEIFN